MSPPPLPPPPRRFVYKFWRASNPFAYGVAIFYVIGFVMIVNLLVGVISTLRNGQSDMQPCVAEPAPSNYN